MDSTITGNVFSPIALANNAVSNTEKGDGGLIGGGGVVKSGIAEYNFSHMPVGNIANIILR